MIIIETIFILLVPYLILKYRKTKLVTMIGTAGMAYLLGICFSIIATVLVSVGIIETRNSTVAEIIAYLGIAIAIPLLLFSSNIKNIFKLSKKVLLSFFLLMSSVLVITLTLFLIYSKNILNGDIFVGMAAALNTGGTPNLNAVAYFFQLKQDLILTANLSDVIFGGVFYMFLIFLAKPIVTKILIQTKDDSSLMGNTLYHDDLNYSFKISNKGVIRNIVLSLLIVLLSAGFGYLIFVLKGSVKNTLTDYLVPALMIGTAIGGIVFSFNSKISEVNDNNIMGQYFVCLFSCTIASMLDFTKFNAVSFQIFLIFSIIRTGTFFLHLILCKIFNIDANTMIVTSTAGIFGPAFIPGVSKAIDAEYLLAPGLITGSFGYAVGTFFGIMATYLCRFLV